MATVALTLIARDEARAIERCLRSVAPWVDEMLVVDTGSTDATPELARACGARVLHFDWVDDFSAARNYALDHTDCDWRLVLDADEWIESGGELLAALRRQAWTEPFVGQVEVCSYFDPQPTGSARGHGAQPTPADARLEDAIEVTSTDAQSAGSWIWRLLPKGVRYVGRIHEQPEHAWPVRRLALRVGHDGYLAALRAPKRERNRRLLGQALAERPDDAYLLYQYGKDCEADGDHAEAVPLYLRAYSLLRDGLLGQRAAPAWLHDLVVRLLFCLKSSGRFEAAVQLAERELPHWPHSPDFHFALGDLLLDWALASPERAGELLPMIENAWERCLQIGEAPHLEGAVKGRGSFLAAHNLAVFHASLGHAERAQLYRRTAQDLLQAAAPAVR